MKYRLSSEKLPFRFQVTKTVQAKLILFLLLVAILPLFTLGYFSYYKSSQVVNSQFGNYGLYAVQQLKLHLDTNLKQMENITGNILTYLTSTPIVIDDSAIQTYSQYTEERDLKRFLASFTNSDIISVSIITNSGTVYGNDAINGERLIHSGFWKSSPEQSWTRNKIAIHRPNYYSSKQTDYVISLAVPVRKQFGLPDGSHILIDMKADSILRLFRTFENDMKAHLRILDSTGAVLLQTSADFSYASNDILWSEQLAANGWVIEARLPYKQFYESSGVILKYLLFISVLALVFAVVMAGIFASKFTMPIKEMVKSMKRFGQGDLSIQTRITSSDELGYLGDTFNRMTEQIRQLVSEISHTEKLKSEAELKALHYQINPHLLFNTLNSIQWKARLAGQPEIQKMLVHLVAVLEASFNFKQALVPLQTELEVAHHYLEIQRFRYGNVFTVFIHVEPGLEECLIPRMVLQPLLENIFFHGFIDGRGHLELTITSIQETICMKLVDDGSGIKPEHLAYIGSGQKIPGKQGGLGLRNVDERYKLHFGLQYRMKIESEREKGTRMIFKWPKML
ncbi:MAG: two-component sensor histidine kinase [Paenibacillus sp.]|jgi:two-component system sensor histidine kinase YesM|nr:two-component sensor histidine kinase [Paenibacillus sp.]